MVHSCESHTIVCTGSHAHAQQQREETGKAAGRMTHPATCQVPRVLRTAPAPTPGAPLCCWRLPWRTCDSLDGTTADDGRGRQAKNTAVRERLTHTHTPSHSHTHNCNESYGCLPLSPQLCTVQTRQTVQPSPGPPHTSSTEQRAAAGKGEARTAAPSVQP